MDVKSIMEVDFTLYWTVPASLHVTFQAMVKGYENPNLPVSLNPNATQSAESSSKSNRGVATQPHRIVPPTNDDGR